MKFIEKAKTDCTPKGIPPLDNNALWLAVFVNSLRDIGFTIDTELKKHGGDYTGFHETYRLHSTTILVHQHWDAAK